MSGFTDKKESPLESILEVYKVTQCGDYFMMHFDCFECGEPQFQSHTNFSCNSCSNSFKNLILDVSKAEKHYLVGSLRKKRYTFRKKTLQEMYKEQDEKCAYCFIDLNHNYDIEHIKPLCVGGTNTKNNICLSCNRCNSLAGSKYFSDFFAKQRYILDQIQKRTKTA